MDIFTNLGFESAEQAIGILFILIIILFAICIALIIGIITLLVRKKDFSKQYSDRSSRAYSNAGYQNAPRGKKNVRIDKAVIEKMVDIEYNQNQLTKNVDDLYRKLGFSYQKVGMVKYNAYTGLSGNTSFVMAMLDGNDSGFILNVINGNEGSNIYMKDVENGESTERLGMEEAEALKIAISQN